MNAVEKLITRCKKVKLPAVGLDYHDWGILNKGRKTKAGKG